MKALPPEWHRNEYPGNTMNKIRDILGEHVEFENITMEYYDLLDRLAEQIFISVEPVLRNKPDRIDDWNLDLDCKKLDSAIVNYIESAVIKDKLKTWIRKETGTEIMADPFTRPLRIEENPEKPVGAETKTLQRHIEIAQNSCPKNRIFFARNYTAKETEAAAKAVQIYLDDVKTGCTAWNEDTELQLFKGLTKIIPGNDPHTKHIISIDITQWFCIKNRLTYYPLDELYFTEDKEIAETPNTANSEDKLVSNIHHRYCMDCLRFPTQKGTAGQVQRTVSIVRKLLKENARETSRCLDENKDPEYIGIHIAKKFCRCIESGHPDEYAQKEFINAIEKHIAIKTPVETNAGTLDEYAYRIYVQLFAETGKPVLIHAEPGTDAENSSTKWRRRRLTSAETDIRTIKTAVSCRTAGAKAVSRGIAGVKELGALTNKVSPLFSRHENTLSDQNDISEEELRTAAEKLTDAFAEEIPDCSISDPVVGYYLYAALDSGGHTLFFDKEKYHDLRFINAQNLLRKETEFSDTAKHLAETIRTFCDDDADIIQINKTVMEIVTAAKTVQTFHSGFSANAHMYLKSFIEEILSFDRKWYTQISGWKTLIPEETLTEVIYEAVCREYEIPPYLAGVDIEEDE